MEDPSLMGAQRREIWALQRKEATDRYAKDERRRIWFLVAGVGVVLADSVMILLLFLRRAV